ncbi:MAG: hypothetical protein BWX81_02341 [Spirochaetes bacterium ADurb.Bin110]|nr:MAG: hypothetical protein BWX81_02341 [Spirochaetes bacterium ADurb.Bin110]
MQSNGKINEESPQQPFELLLLTIERDLPVLSVGLPFIIQFIIPQKIKIIASSSCIEKAKSLGLGLDRSFLDKSLNKSPSDESSDQCSRPVIEYLDEDTVVPGLSLAAVKHCIQAHGGNGDRAGWYFKQLLLLAYATQPSPYRYYLVWDTDTIPVRPLSFFDETSRVLMTTKKELHATYFRTMERLIGIGKVAHDSFIAEHMMFERPHVLRLLACIMNHVSINDSENDAHKESCNEFFNTLLDAPKFFDAQKFIEAIISAIEPEELDASGFSEYETYGSFMYHTARERIALRELPSMRLGSSFFDRPPTTKQLFALSRHYYWASFEAWHSTRIKTRAKHSVRHLLGILWTTAAVLLLPNAFNRFRKEVMFE